MNTRKLIIMLAVFILLTACDNLNIDFGGDGEGDYRTVCGKVIDRSTGNPIEEALITIYHYESFMGTGSYDVLSIAHSESSGYFSTNFFPDVSDKGAEYVLICSITGFERDTIKFEDGNQYFTIKLNDNKSLSGE